MIRPCIAGNNSKYIKSFLFAKFLGYVKCGCVDSSCTLDSPVICNVADRNSAVGGWSSDIQFIKSFLKQVDFPSSLLLSSTLKYENWKLKSEVGTKQCRQALCMHSKGFAGVLSVTFEVPVISQ